MSPHRAALILTTPPHPFAYFVYGAQVILGPLLVVGAITIESLSKLLLLPVAGVIMTAGGLVAVYAITSARKTTAKDPPLRLEQVSAWVVGVINALFSVAMFTFYDWTTAVPTKTYVTGIAIACIYRAVEIRNQRARLKVALAQFVPSVPVLAERADPEE